MKDRIDPLIAERAPWLPKAPAALRKLIEASLGYSKTVGLAQGLSSLDDELIMASMGRRLARRVTARGLENIPRNGAALIVANHPTGIADGVILNEALRLVRPDTYFFANSDVLRVLPQLDQIICPVEWRKEKRSHAKTKATLDFTRAAVAQNRLGVIFPSGRLAKRKGLKLHERPWMTSAAMIARKFELPVIPVNIRARNSALFYLFDLVHPTLRDITLFHETLNKDQQPFEITVGDAINGAGLPTNSGDATGILRNACLSLGGNGRESVGLIETTARPSWARI